mgnify:CR=1 FL=1
MMWSLIFFLCGILRNDREGSGQDAAATSQGGSRPVKASTTALLAVLVPMSIIFPFMALSLTDEAVAPSMEPHSSHGHVLEGTGRRLLWFTSVLQQHAPPACVNTSDIPQAAQARSSSVSNLH